MRGTRQADLWGEPEQRFRVGRQDLALLMGVHADRVTKFVGEGMPVFRTDDRGRAVEFDAVACLAWQRERHGGSSDDARARKDRATAELTEIRILEKRGALLPRDQVVNDGRAVVLAIKAHLMKLPKRMLLAGLVMREKEAAVANMIREALGEMSRWSTLTELQKVAGE